MLHVFWNSIYYAMDSTQTWLLARSGLLGVDVIELSTSQKPPTCVPPARAKVYSSSANLFILHITESRVPARASSFVFILLLTEGCVARRLLLRFSAQRNASPPKSGAQTWQRQPSWSKNLISFFGP